MKKTSAPALLITKFMRVSDIMTLCPPAKKVMAEYGIHCAGCSMNMQETLAEGGMLHGFSDEEVDALVDDINDLMKEMPARPEELTITKSAANAIKDVATNERKVDPSADSGGKRKVTELIVLLDENGGFCMEFDKPEKNMKKFMNEEVKDVKVFASLLTLKRIGGSTIDFREGRFKLDLPENDISSCGCDGKNCSCKGKSTMST